MPAEVAMPGKSTSPAEVTTSQHYDAHVDLEGFRDLFLAQQHNYLRKLGLACAILCGGFAIMIGALWCLARPGCLASPCSCTQ